MKLGDAFPPDLLLKSLLVRGAAFWGPYEFNREGEKDRLFFVLNADPGSDSKIFLLTATTQVESRRAHHGKRSGLVLVDLLPSQYQGVSRHSVVDCERDLVRRKREDFEKQAKQRLYRVTASLPEGLIKSIMVCVASSKTISSAEKRLILGSASGQDS